MRRILSFLLLGLCVPMAAFAASAPENVCNLLDKAKLEQAQNAKFSSAQPTGHDNGNFTASQCFYRLQPESSSVSLQVISASAKERFDAREFWRKKFRPSKEEQAEDSERKSEVDREREEAEAKHKRPPQHVAGVGDDAFWVNTGRDGALYVLSGGKILRLSLGGRAPQADKLKQASVLAKSAIQKLNESSATAKR